MQPIETLIITGSAQAVAALEAGLGPCAAESGAGPVWAEDRSGAAGSRIFTGPLGIMACVRSGAVQLAPGVTASIGSREPSAVALQGGGAGFWAVAQSSVGIRQQPFPPLPNAWSAAIQRAAGGGSAMQSATAQSAEDAFQTALRITPGLRR